MLQEPRETRDIGTQWLGGFLKSHCVLLFLVIVSSLAFMSLLPASMLYESIGHLDTYVYTGYGYMYPDRLFPPGYYKISRLPWILFLSMYHHLVNSDYATPVLAVFFVLAQGILVYAISWRFFRNLTASALTSIFVVMSSLWYNVGGWNYHASFGGIVLWLSILFLPLKASEISLKQYFLSFGLFSISLHANPLHGPTIPAFIVLSLMPMFDATVDAVQGGGGGSCWNHGKRFLIRIVLYAIGSFVFMTAVLSGIHKLLYGSSRFYDPGLQLILGSARDPSTAHAVSLPMEWKWLSYPYILFFIGVLFCAAFILAKRLKNPEMIKTAHLLAAYSFLIALLVFLVFQAYGLPMLGIGYIAFPLQCYGVLVMAAFCDLILSPYRLSSIAAVFVLLGGGVLFALTGIAGSGLSPLYPMAAFIVVLVLLDRLFSENTKRLGVVKAVFLVFFLCTMDFPMRIQMPAQSDSGRIQIAVNKAMYRYCRFLIDLNMKEMPGEVKKEMHRNFATAYVDGDVFEIDGSKVIASYVAHSFLQLGSCRFLGAKWGDFVLSQDKIYEINYTEGMRVVVLGSSRDLEVKIEDGLRRLGLEPTLQHMRPEIADGVEVYMWIYRVAKAGAA